MRLIINKMSEEKTHNRISWSKILESSARLFQYITDKRELFAGASRNNPRTAGVACITYRILRNLRAVHVLSVESTKRPDSVFLKLPIGLIIRNCLMDGILALYIVNNNDEVCKNLNALGNRNYVNALFDEYEVYRDKLTFPVDNVVSEHLYTMAIEDTFLEDLSINENNGTIIPLNERYTWRAREFKDIYEGCKRSDADIRNMKDKLTCNRDIEDCVRCLYAYYKYFSQFEHYSQRGDGDSLADFGNDNIKFEKVFIHLENCIKYLVEFMISQKIR